MTSEARPERTTLRRHGSDRARRGRIAFGLSLLLVLLALASSRSAAAAEPEPEPAREAKWGEWVAADEGMTPGDMRLGIHAQHIALADSRVGGGKRGRDYGFRRPLVYTVELGFSAFTSKNLSVGVLFQPAAFGGQDGVPTADGERPAHTRSPFVLGMGLLVEGGFSLGPLLFRPGMATGGRGVMLIQDRSGKQSPPAVAQWFVDLRGTTEIALGKSAAIGVGMSLDVLRPTDWGTFGYLSWRFGDVAKVTR
jgi:hypothetical protein